MRKDTPSKLMTVLGLVLCSSLLIAQSFNNGGQQVIWQDRMASCTSAPAVGTQATCSIALNASARHVAHCVGFSAAATTAPTLTQLNVNLRNGASGAGTIVWQKRLAIPASTGQLSQPHTVCGLGIIGSVNTAMTLEFSAALTNLFEEVSLSTYPIK